MYIIPSDAKFYWLEYSEGKKRNLHFSHEHNKLIEEKRNMDCKMWRGNAASMKVSPPCKLVYIPRGKRWHLIQRLLIWVASSQISKGVRFGNNR